MYIDTVFSDSKRQVWHVFALGYTDALKPYEQKQADALHVTKYDMED
jgi:hypothetical protein